MINAFAFIKNHVLTPAHDYPKNFSLERAIVRTIHDIEDDDNKESWS